MPEPDTGSNQEAAPPFVEPATTAGPGSRKIIHLEGLRGLAAMQVVMLHFVTTFYPTLHLGTKAAIHNAYEAWAGVTPFNLIYAGDFAVCIFFYLSGYVLSTGYFIKQDRSVIISSSARRYFRLTIPVLVSCIIAYFLLTYGLFYNKKAVTLTLSHGWLDTFYRMKPDFSYMLQEATYYLYRNGFCAYNRVAWTMRVELWGSFLVFGFLFLFGRFKYRHVIYLLLALVYLRGYYLGFVLGMLLCDLRINKGWPGKGPKTGSYKLGTAVMLCFGLFLGSYPYAKDILWVYKPILQVSTALNASPYTFSHMIGAFLTLLAIERSQAIQGFLSTKPIAFLGKISYSVYLTHVIIVMSLSCYLFSVLIEYLSYNAAVLITFLATLCFLIPFAYLYYRLVDGPSISFTKKAYNRIVSRGRDSRAEQAAG